MRDHLIQPKAIYPFFDEVLATGPFVIIPPGILRGFFAVGYNDLVVVFHMIGIKEFKLFLWTILALDFLPYNHHSEAGIFLEHIYTLRGFYLAPDIFPIPHPLDFLLDPGLDRDNDVKFDLLLEQELEHFAAKETPICSKPYILYVRRQPLDYASEKFNGIIRTVVLAAPEKAPNIISLSPTKHRREW
jgi:hypothetical protein